MLQDIFPDSPTLSFFIFFPLHLLFLSPSFPSYSSFRKFVCFVHHSHCIWVLLQPAILNHSHIYIFSIYLFLLLLFFIIFIVTMSDVVLVDLDERETWALLTTISYMQQAGYCLAPNLIEDYANNVLENTSALQTQSPSMQGLRTDINAPASSSHIAPSLSQPSLLSSAHIVKDEPQTQSIQPTFQKLQRKVNPSFIANLLLNHPENIPIPSNRTLPISPVPNAINNKIPNTPSRPIRPTLPTLPSMPSTLAETVPATQLCTSKPFKKPTSAPASIPSTRCSTPVIPTLNAELSNEFSNAEFSSQNNNIIPSLIKNPT